MTLLIVAAGCGLLPPSRAGRMPGDDLMLLRAGMDGDDLRFRIGTPDDVTSEPDGSESWTYLYGRDDPATATAVVVSVRDGTVRSWEQRPAE